MPCRYAHEDSYANYELKLKILREKIKKSKQHTFCLQNSCHPQTLSVLKTRANPLGIKIIEGEPNDDTFGCFIQNPDTYGEIHDFEVTYKQISTCHLFETYQSLKDTNERKIFVLNRVFNDNNCEELEDELISKQLHFEVTRQDYYIFKFWQGTDSNNEDIFLTKKIPVKVE